jgi:hypothetical protein
VYVFGGIDAHSVLQADMWVLDLEAQQWHQLLCDGHPPSGRRGATLVASEDGRRIYVVGGWDGKVGAGQGGALVAGCFGV